MVTKHAEVSLYVLDMSINEDMSAKGYWNDTFNKKSIHDKEGFGDNRGDTNSKSRDDQKRTMASVIDYSNEARLG